MEEKMTIKIKRVVTDPSKPILTAHFIGFSRVGQDIMMDIGFWDLNDLANILNEAKSKGEAEIEATGYINERYSIPLNAFSNLFDRVNEFMDILKKEGYIKDE